MWCRTDRLCRALLCGLVLATESLLAAETDQESALRAAFLYRLIDFVTWPAERFPNPNTPIRVCLPATSDPTLKRELERAIQRRSTKLRPLAIVELESGEACELVYLDRDPSGTESFDRGTLIVVDSNQRLRQRGHLALALEVTGDGRGRLVFHGDRKRLTQAQFSLSSKLLALVRFDA